MCERNGSYGMPHFTLMRFIFIKQRIKLAVSLLNWKRTYYLFGARAAVVVGWEPSPRHRPSPRTPAWASSVSGPHLPKLGSNLVAMGAPSGHSGSEGSEGSCGKCRRILPSRLDSRAHRLSCQRRSCPACKKYWD